jgi:mannan endo-1,4-beta-mannosidase
VKFLLAPEYSYYRYKEKRMRTYPAKNNFCLIVMMLLAMLLLDCKLLKALRGEECTCPVDADVDAPDSGVDADAGEISDPIDADVDFDIEPGEIGRGLHIEGRFLVDDCGNRVIMRGVEQIINLGVGPNYSNDLIWLIDEIAFTGANAIRLLPYAWITAEELGLAAVLDRAIGHGIVVILSPTDWDSDFEDSDEYQNWFIREDIQPVLATRQQSIIIEALCEVRTRDSERWIQRALYGISFMRSHGYTGTLSVISNAYGRDLPTTLEHGASVIATDPLGNTMINWQAYWGRSNWYQENDYFMTLHQAMEYVRDLNYPVQVGIIRYPDSGDEMDYLGVMADAEAFDIGWLWWDWYNPYGQWGNHLTSEGTFDTLTDFAAEIVITDENSIQNTSIRPCLN